MAISVAIVEDNPEVRRNLSRYIGGAPGFRCACACASAEEALREIPKSPPDVVLMDIQLPGMSGIACTASLKKALPLVPVMMLTVFRSGSAARDSQIAAGRRVDGHPTARDERHRLHRFAQEGPPVGATNDAHGVQIGKRCARFPNRRRTSC